MALFYATAFVFTGLLVWLGGYLDRLTGDRLLAAVFANWLALRFTKTGTWWKSGYG